MRLQYRHGRTCTHVVVGRVNIHEAILPEPTESTFELAFSTTYLLSQSQLPSALHANKLPLFPILINKNTIYTTKMHEPHFVDDLEVYVPPIAFALRHDRWREGNGHFSIGANEVSSEGNAHLIQ